MQPNQGISALHAAGQQPGVAAPMNLQQTPPPDSGPQATPQGIKEMLLKDTLVREAREADAATSQRQQTLQPQGPVPIAQQLDQQAQQVQQAKLMREQQMAQQRMAQMPIQHAAHGGLMRGGIDRVPSNLRMAGGGIIGFEEGGGVQSPEEIVSDGPQQPQRSLLRMLQDMLTSPQYDWKAKAQASEKIKEMSAAQPTGAQNQRGDNLYVPEQPTPQKPPPATTAGSGGSGSRRQGISALTSGPSAPAAKNRLEALADAAAALYAGAANPEEAYAEALKRSKRMDGGDSYLSTMKTLMAKQEELAKPGERGILDKLIPMLRGAATSAPGSHWSQVLTGGAVGSIDHEAKLAAEQKKAQALLLDMQGLQAGKQYDITSGRNTAGITAENAAKAGKRQSFGDRVQTEGALETSNMSRAKLLQDAAQHKESMAAKWSEINARAGEHKDNKMQSEARQLETNMRTNATNRAAAEQKALGMAFDPVDLQARSEVILAREMQNSVQFKALMTKLGMPLLTTKEAPGAGIDLSKWGQPKAK